MILKKLLIPKPWVAKWLVIAILLGFFGLGWSGYFEPIRAFLDSDLLAFNIGTTRFSAYLILKAAIIIALLFWLAEIFSEFGERRIQSIQGVETRNKALIIKVLQILIYLSVLVIGLDLFDIDLTSLAVFSGAVGIGVGFGLQKITANFISGLILLFEKSIEHDDLIELADGTYGFVRHIGARHTLVETFEDKEIMIPNEDFITSRVINWTYSSKRARVDINIGISYESDIDKAMELILEAAQTHPRCISEPEPMCYLRNFGDNSIDFLLHFWIEDITIGRYQPQSEVMQEIWKQFRAHHIGIPYPQRDIHIKSSESALS